MVMDGHLSVLGVINLSGVICNMGLDDIGSKMDSRSSRLPDEVVSFNPTSDDDIEKLLCKFGPEGLFEMSWRLRDAAQDDIDSALEEAAMPNMGCVLRKR
jgi:hypothetical protein